MNQKNQLFIAARLAEIKRHYTVMVDERKAYERKVEAARIEYSKNTTGECEALEKANKQLMSHLKKNKLDIFPGKTDRVEIAGGVVLRHMADIVRKARHITVLFLRGLGLEDGIHIEETVDWKKINDWVDDQLAIIGTERTPKESFAYELTEDK